MARIQDHGIVALLNGHAAFGRQVSRGFYVGDDRLGQQAAAGGVQRMCRQIRPVLSEAEHVERGRRLVRWQGQIKIGRHRTAQATNVPTDLLRNRRKFAEPRGRLCHVLGGNHEEFTLLWVCIDDAPRHPGHDEACDAPVVLLAAVVERQHEGFVHRSNRAARHRIPNAVGVLVWNHGQVVADPGPGPPRRAVPSLRVAFWHGGLQREHVIGKLLVGRVPLWTLRDGMALLLQHLNGFSPHRSRPPPPWNLGVHFEP